MPHAPWPARAIAGAWRLRLAPLLAGLAIAGCSQPPAPAGAANAAQDAPNVDAAMAICSNLAGDNAARIAACTAVVQASGAPAGTRAKALNNRGVLTSFQGDLDRAISDYDAAIQLDPNYAAAYYNRAKAWRQKGDAARADADAAEAVRLNPGLAGR